MSPAQLNQSLRQFASKLLPRLLTQCCRDPHSAAWGCFDRDWWHYKIRDFPSVILQQGAYALWVATRVGLLPQDEVKPLVQAAVRFWNHRAQRHGAFEEYYPWEQGYPPLAFSTLAVAKLIAEEAAPFPDAAEGLAVAARQLLRRFEPQAANQQVAGLAALAWIRKSQPSLVPDAAFDRVSKRTLGLQTSEGWFEEYGGPDLGYLSVTLDCLWDLFDATDDPAYVDAVCRAVAFMRPFACLPGRGAGMHNARNTDYFVPYGLARLAESRRSEAAVAEHLLNRTWGNLDDAGHIAHATDDRYWTHYIGHSLLRAAETLGGARERRFADAAAPTRQFFPLSGHLLLQSDAISMIISGRKGGVLSAWSARGQLSDFGWIVVDPSGKNHFVTHWWADFWTITHGEESCSVEGHATGHLDTVSSPAKHIALRFISYFFGRHIIGLLKRRMIFKPQARSLGYERAITWTDQQVEVHDTFRNLPPGARLLRAPRTSRRHVASADSFHVQDLSLLHGCQIGEWREQSGGEVRIRTVYTLG